LETILFRFTETYQTATHPCLIMQRYEINSDNASKFPILTLEILAPFVLDRSYGNG